MSRGDRRQLSWLADIPRDAGYALRALARRPGLTATAVLSLALGIGANTGIFSLVDQALLRRLPVAEPHRLVRLAWRGFAAPLTSLGAVNVLSYPLCRELEQQARFLDGVLCRSEGLVNVSMGGPFEQLRAEVVSGSYFDVLGVGTAAGRVIGPADDTQVGQHPVVVLAYDFWKNRLGGAADVVGRRIVVNTHPMTVIGVAAPGFRGTDVGAAASLWIPTAMAREALIEFNRILDRRAFWVQAFGRLNPGVDAAAAEAGLQPWFKTMLAAETRLEGFPRLTDDQRRGFLASTMVVRDAAQGWSALRDSVSRPLWLLMIGTTLLLLLAVLNVASLLLARGAERSQELATRMALGASRGRVARQVLVEGLLLACAGGLIGLAAAPVVSRLLLRFMPEGADLEPAVDLRIFGFALAASVVSGALCGLAPALQAARRPLASSISGRSTAAGVAVRFRKILVAAQLALTLVLLAGAGLFVQTLTTLAARDRGFDTDRLVMFRADPAGTVASAADAPRVLQDVLRALRAAPGVDRAAVANNSVLSGIGPSRVLTIAADRRITAEGSVPLMRIGPGFFATLGVPLLAGREFDERDTLDIEKTGIRKVIVNASFARRYFGGASPIGRFVGFGVQPDTPTDVEIVGVVSDFRRRLLRDDDVPEHIFVPFAQAGPQAGDGAMYVRVRGEPEAALSTVRAAVASVDPRLPVTGLTTVEDQASRSLRYETMLATLSASFGAVALLLSVVGLFGMMSFVVMQRTPEIGMRMALGATRAGAVGLIVRDALATIGAGAAAGLTLAVTVGVLASSWLKRVLVDVTSSDITTFVGATLTLIVVALAACIVPAQRAALLSPMVAIRDQGESVWRMTRRRVRRVIRDLAAAPLPAAPSVTLIGELTGLVQGAASFSDALQVALPALRERVGAEFILLLERVSSDELRGGDCTIPARGVLVTRLTRYPHPLPFSAGDLSAWLTWAREQRPEHVAEIEQLQTLGVRMAVALRTTRGVVGVLLLGSPSAPKSASGTWSTSQVGPSGAARAPETLLGSRHGFTEADKQVLGSAAEVFALMIENARLNDRALEQEKVRRDLALAAEVQRRLLPTRPPGFAGAALAAFTLPARGIGGDFYDFVDLPGGCLGIAVSDVAGKGIAAALLTSVVQASLRVITAEGEIAPSELAARMNRFLQRSTSSNGYATFFFARLDPGGRRLRYVNAGHNPPCLVRRRDGGVEVTELAAGGTVLGLFPEAAYEDAVVDLCPGDLLVAFTDGLTEARSTADEEFGEDRLKDLLRGAVGMPADEVLSLLAARMREWIAGAEQHDDLTFVVATMG